MFVNVLTFGLMEWHFNSKLIWPERHSKLSLHWWLWNSVSCHHLRDKDWLAPHWPVPTAWTGESLPTSESNFHRPHMSLPTSDRNMDSSYTLDNSLRQEGGGQITKLSGFHFPNSSSAPSSKIKEAQGFLSPAGKEREAQSSRFCMRSSYHLLAHYHGCVHLGDKMINT